MHGWSNFQRRTLSMSYGEHGRTKVDAMNGADSGRITVGEMRLCLTISVHFRGSY